MFILELIVEFILDLFFDYAMSPKAPKLLRVITFSVASLVLVPLSILFFVMIFKMPATTEPLINAIVIKATMLFLVVLVSYLYFQILTRFILTNRLLKRGL